MYNETWHPITKETLNWALENKSYSEEEREIIIMAVEKANLNKERHVVIDLPSGEYLIFDNGILVGSRADAI